MNIDAASPRDLDTVIGWIGSERDCRLWAGPAVTYPIRRAALLDQIDFDPDTALVGKAAGLLLAFGQLLQTEQGAAHLARIITNPDYRGQGLGVQFCRHLLRRATAGGAATVSLNVYRSNTRAVGLYRGLGFTVDGPVSDDGAIRMLYVPGTTPAVP